MSASFAAEFAAEVFEWRGPAPYHFVALPADLASEIAEDASAVTYGWGMVPVSARIGDTAFTTSLWPKSGTYYLPLKDAVRDVEGIDLGDVIEVSLRVRPR